MIHVMYTYKNKFYQCYKGWDINRIESVLKRLGASYWELGVPNLSVKLK